MVVTSACCISSASKLVMRGAVKQAARKRVIIQQSADFDRLASLDLAVLDEKATLAADSTECIGALKICALRRVVEDLKRMKIETVLFSSQLEPVALSLGNSIGVDGVEAELFPEDKECKIAALRRGGKKVVMIGDGVDDTEALSSSHSRFRSRGHAIQRANGDRRLRTWDKAPKVLLRHYVSPGVYGGSPEATLLDLSRPNAIGIGLAASGVIGPYLQPFFI